MAFGTESQYSTSAYRVPPACSFSSTRARILGHPCSTDSEQSGEDVFASLDGRHTCIPYPTVVSLRNCGTPLLGPTHSTCAPPTCTLNIDFERPTMPLQLYKKSRPFDFCSLSYSSAQVQKSHVLPPHPCWAPSFSTQRSGPLHSLDIQTTPDIGQSNAPRPTFPRPLAPELSPALSVKVYCMYTHSSGDNHQNR